MSLNPNICLHCNEKTNTKYVGIDYSGKTTLHIQYNCLSCNKDWIVTCQIKGKSKKDVFERNPKTSIIAKEPELIGSSSSKDNIVSDLSIMKFIEKQEKDAVTLNNAFKDAFRKAQESRQPVWLCFIDDGFHLFECEPKYKDLLELGKPGECWKVGTDGLKENVKISVPKELVEIKKLEITDRKNFILKAVLGYALANRTSLNEFFMDGDQISIGGQFGDKIEAKELDELISNLSKSRIQEMI